MYSARGNVHHRGHCELTDGCFLLHVVFPQFFFFFKVKSPSHPLLNSQSSNRIEQSMKSGVRCTFSGSRTREQQTSFSRCVSAQTLTGSPSDSEIKLIKLDIKHPGWQTALKKPFSDLYWLFFLYQNGCLCSLGNKLPVSVEFQPIPRWRWRWRWGWRWWRRVPPLVQPGSWQLPRRVEELDGVIFGPLGEHRLLRDEAVAAIGGALVQHVLCTLVPAAGLVVMIGNLFVTLRPEGKKKDKRGFNFTPLIENQEVK